MVNDGSLNKPFHCWVKDYHFQHFQQDEKS